MPPLLQESGLVAMRERVRLLLAERARLAAALGASGQFTRVWPSDANFLLVDCREPDDVLTRARRAGLLIRDVRQAALPRIGAHFRRHPPGKRPLAGVLAMNPVPQRVLFVDRDGTLIEEPPDEQVDSLEKIRFLPGVFAALQRLTAAGYRLVMVTNQDGLGTASFPIERFELAQDFVLRAFRLTGTDLRRGVHLPASPGRSMRLSQAQARSGATRIWRAPMSTLPLAP